MKKTAILALVLAMCVSLLVLMPTSVAAASVSIEDDFISYTDGDTGELSMAKIFAMESGTNVRIKYAFGKGYCCPTGGGVTASLVYKVETGGAVDDLSITVKGHFASRAGYSEDWTSAPEAIVEVSPDGTNYTKVATWEGELYDMTLGQNDYKDLAVKTYTADLADAAGEAETVWVRLSWNVYDFPLYSSVHNVKIEGGAGGSAPAPESSEPAPESSEPAPESSEPAPESSEPAPESSEPAPESSEPAPESSEPAPESSEPAPESSEPAPESSEPAPESSEPAPESSEPASEPESSEDDTDVVGSAPSDEPDGGLPIGAIVAIVVVCVLLAGGAIVFLLYKKGSLAKK